MGAGVAFLVVGFWVWLGLSVGWCDISGFGLGCLRWVLTRVVDLPCIAAV